jgi:hypothetical protein
MSDTKPQTADGKVLFHFAMSLDGFGQRCYGPSLWHCTVRLVYGVLHGLVLRFGEGWDLGPAGRTHASAGPLL